VNFRKALTLSTVVIRTSWY